MKIVFLIFAVVVLFPCMQAGTLTPETVDRETVSTVRKYVYADSMGNRLIIENSFSRGGAYTDSHGKGYSTIMFWTRIINETENPLELTIDLPIHSYEVPTLPGKYFKVLIPPDTLTLDRELLQDYGIKDLKSFIDNSIHKPVSLKRTISPKESSGFYFVLLFDSGVPGPTRTGLFIKGQDLYYNVTRYSGKKGGTFVDEKEIHCGSINLKNLIRR